MKMKRLFAWEMALLKSDSLGHGVSRYQCVATKLNWLQVKVHRSALASWSVAKSYDKYNDWVRVSKKHWISTSVLLVTMIFSHGACAAALVRTFRRCGWLWALPHSSSASMTKTRVCSGWRGREQMKSIKREPFINSGVRFGLSQRCPATIIRKGGKSMASLWMKVGRMFMGSLKFGLSLWQKNTPARWFCLWRLADRMG